MDIADVIISVAGRDKGALLYVLDTKGEYLLTVNGKERRVDNPKRKKNKHVQFLAKDNSTVADKIRNKQTVTDSEIRTALAVFGEYGHLDQEG